MKGKKDACGNCKEAFATLHSYLSHPPFRNAPLPLIKVLIWLVVGR